MIFRNTPVLFRSGAALALAAGLAFGASACDDDGDDGEPDISIVDELESDPDVPFDPDVGPGVDTNTDERGNLGFDVDEP